MAKRIKRGQRSGIKPDGGTRVFWFTDRRSRINAERMALLWEKSHMDIDLSKKTKAELVQLAKEKGLKTKDKTKAQLLEEFGS